MVRPLARHELIEHFVAQLPVWGREMLYVRDDVLDVRITHVDGKVLTLVAEDLFGDGQACVTVALHLFEDFTTDAALHSYLAGDIYDALVDSYFRGGKTVILA